MTKTNDFTLSMTGMSDMNFVISDHSITSGEKWKGITGIKCNGDGSCTITVEADRKGSKDVAKWFKSEIGSGSAIGTNTIDQLPDKLNFAFTGTMTFKHGGKNYKGADIVIAQGHGGMRNNWWVGGKDMSGLTVPVLGGAIAQTFNQNGVPVSKVAFATVIGQVSSMNMGLVAL